MEEEIQEQILVYPNPSQSSVTFSFALQQKGDVSFLIFDMTGRLVKTIAKSELNKGSNTIQYDHENLTNGLYYFTFQSGLQTANGSFVVN